MPTYEYACSKCDQTFEVFQSMKDKPLTKCPDKGCKGRVKRLLGTGAGLIFKGSGFYITDYRSEGYKSAAKSDTPAASSGGGAAGEGGSSGSKSEAPAAAKSGGEAKPAAKAAKKSGSKE